MSPSLDHLAPLTASPSPVPPAGASGWTRHLSFARPGGRPRWLLALFLTALVYTVMPLVHNATFGEDRVVEALVTQAETSAGAEMSEQGVQTVREYVHSRSSGTTSVVGFGLTLVAVLLSGALLNAGALLLGIRLSAVEALSIASLSALAVAVVRVLLWGMILGLHGLDGGAAVDWSHVAPANLGVLAPAGTGAMLLALLAALDFTLMFGVAVSTAGVLAVSPGTRLRAALTASAGWMSAVVLFRVVAAFFFNLPIG